MRLIGFLRFVNKRRNRATLQLYPPAPGKVALTWGKNGRRIWSSGDEELEGLMTTRNTTTVILVLLNGLHTAFVLTSETEKNLVSGQVDKAYDNLTRLETAVRDVRDKNGDLGVVGGLLERVGVLKDILCVETEKVWGKLVLFSEEGDIQLTIHKHVNRTTPPQKHFLTHSDGDVDIVYWSGGRVTQVFGITGRNDENSRLVTVSSIPGSFTFQSCRLAIHLQKTLPHRPLHNNDTNKPPP